MQIVQTTLELATSGKHIDFTSVEELLETASECSGLPVDQELDLSLKAISPILRGYTDLPMNCCLNCTSTLPALQDGSRGSCDNVTGGCEIAIGSLGQNGGNRIQYDGARAIWDTMLELHDGVAREEFSIPEHLNLSNCSGHFARTTDENGHSTLYLAVVHDNGACMNPPPRVKKGVKKNE